MKKLLFLALLLGAFFFWKNLKGASSENPISSPSNNESVVIEFTDSQDLLAQLRQVETGRKLDLRQKTQETTYTSTGIACNDEVAKKAFMEKMDREAEQLTKDITIEMKRIQQVQ